MSTELWKLEILVDGGTYCVFGTEQVLRHACDEWKQWRGNPARDDSVLLLIDGQCDSSDRAEHHLAIPCDRVVLMSLIRER